MNSPTRTVEQTALIKEARAYVAAIGPINATAAPQILGQLMEAEGLLLRIVKAFEQPAT
ncbi:hypothetical protein [Streptomyces malaysiensis]|uniref:hypothetical protein n=1 Tax=Streptomyces malaysiensis TaxID=92644 RepID=UPI00367440AA